MLGYETQRQTVDPIQNAALSIKLSKTAVAVDEVVVSATRANQKSAIAYTDVTRRDLNKLNLGQDIPQLLNFTPSIVTTSDAGAGVGYTGIRIRGSDATRVNVTLNGIPYNDAESQGTFFVNMPDFASSVSSIQIQRGRGYIDQRGRGIWRIGQYSNQQAGREAVCRSKPVGRFVRDAKSERTGWYGSAQ